MTTMMEDDRIRSYKIEVRSAASNWLVLDRTIGSTNTVYSHRDVPTGVSRCYRVSATNTAGTGPHVERGGRHHRQY